MWRNCWRGINFRCWRRGWRSYQSSRIGRVGEGVSIHSCRKRMTVETLVARWSIIEIVRTFWMELMRYCRFVDSIMILLSKISFLVRLFLERNIFFLLFLAFLLWFLLFCLFFIYLLIYIDFTKVDITDPNGEFSLDQFQEEDSLKNTDILSKLNNFFDFLMLRSDSFSHVQIPQKNINIIQTDLAFFVFLAQFLHDSSLC